MVKKVRVAPLHVAGGGELHVTVRHGSGKQAPPLHPEGHGVSMGVYVQPLVPHVPCPNERRVEPMQTDGGGVRQPWQTSPRQLPALQPCMHVVRTSVYWQAPIAHVPGDWLARRMVAEVQTGAGGSVQAAQVTPASPHSDSLCEPGRTHWPVMVQQPSGHEVTSQTQAPAEQR